MKRWLLPASALVLVLIACGAGATSAPRVTEAGAPGPSVQSMVGRREGAALREARALVREFVPPPGARRDRDGQTPRRELVGVYLGRVVR